MRKLLIILALILISAAATAQVADLHGIWINQSDGSQFEFSADEGRILLVGFDLSKGLFRKGDIKYKDISWDAKKKILKGENRVNDSRGNLHSWRKVSFDIRDKSILTITDTESRTSITLRRSPVGTDISALYKVLNGVWTRRDDKSQYLFSANMGSIKSVGFNLEMGKFQLEQIKLRNIVPLYTGIFLAENRMNRTDGSLASWDKVKLTVSAGTLAISALDGANPLMLDLVPELVPTPALASPIAPALAKTEQSTITPNADLVYNIPRAKSANPDAIAVVIGNRDYNESVISKVDYALNDAEAVKQYLISVFGYAEENIIHIKNATLMDFYSVFGKENNHRGKLNSWIEASRNKPDVYVYYSGHGAPDVKSGSAYLVPVDCDSPDRISVNGYSIDTLYHNLAQMKYNSLTVVLEACFSGNSEKGLMLKGTSPVALKAKVEAPPVQNATIVTSTSGEQLAHWYFEKGQSLFTYYYLRGLKGEA
ncbi:MAG: caspase family protein, partial [Candidatus Cloacimonadaceae bacterium]|nr:caspase family protein [Candidatus Cloacimonadaceae bacterium]